MENIVIMGLGRTGLSCVRHFNGLGQTVSVTDSREQPPALAACRQQFPNVPVTTGGFDEAQLRGADHIVLSPGISVNQPAVARAIERGVVVIGDVEVFARHVNAPVAAITGTNGKSTVTALVADMLQAAGKRVYAGGNFGTPVLDLLAQPVPDAYVLELSSFQLQSTTSLRPRVACLLNISPDHLDWHQDMDEYLRAKLRVFHAAQTAVVYADDERLSPREQVNEQITFSIHREAHCTVRQTERGLCLVYGDELICPLDAMRMAGKHNWENALAASAMAIAMGVAIKDCRSVLEHFSGLEHRCQWVAESDGVRWFNDSKGTNVGATVAAINSLADDCERSGGKIILIAGGLSKGADFQPLRKSVRQWARSVIMFGADAAKMQTALKDTTLLIRASSLEEAVNAAHRWAQAGDVVLFSPACASFDMFDNYRHRGDCFVRAVKEICHDR